MKHTNLFSIIITGTIFVSLIIIGVIIFNNLETTPPNTKKLYQIEKDSSVKVFVQDTVKKDSLSYPVLCDTCLSADLALDSVSVQFYKKEIDELKLAKQMFSIKEYIKYMNKELIEAKRI